MPKASQRIARNLAPDPPHCSGADQTRLAHTIRSGGGRSAAIPQVAQHSISPRPPSLARHLASSTPLSTSSMCKRMYLAHQRPSIRAHLPILSVFDCNVLSLSPCTLSIFPSYIVPNRYPGEFCACLLELGVSFPERRSSRVRIASSLRIELERLARVKT